MGYVFLKYVIILISIFAALSTKLAYMRNRKKNFYTSYRGARYTYICRAINFLLA